ncbi:hypothetical protein ACFWP0_21415 [Achromobacter sp. NPDC058515]|uniref:hypothetical protein n=1 Tax=Achromobacter sp. NPDC058515 TaxID=3346533 RepID=UPI00366086B3
MILKDYLTIQSDALPPDSPCMLGETGFSVPAAALAQSAFRRWCQDVALPASACRIMEQGLYLSGISGLLRVVPASGFGPDPESVWILGRSDQGLLSVVVRDACGADAQRLREDAALALRQAARYTARLAVVLVQSCRGDECMEGYRRFARELGPAPVEQGGIHAAWHSGAGKMLGHGWLRP